MRSFVFMVFFVLSVKQSTPSFAEGSEKLADHLINRLSEINKKQKCDIPSGLEYVCDSMSEFSCKEGTYDDGTGKVLTTEQLFTRINSIEQKVQNLYRDTILKTLSDPSPQFDRVRELAIQATQQGGSVECVSLRKSDQKKCYERIAELLNRRHADLEIFGVRDFSRNPNSGMGAIGAPGAGSNTDWASLDALLKNSSYMNALDSAHEGSMKLASVEQINRKVEKDLFPKVKKILISKIQAMVKDPMVKERLIAKIENINYSGGDCTAIQNELLPSRVGGLLVPNAFYNPEKNDFKMCNGLLLINSSEFALVMVIAHELSHSMDPCQIQKPLGGGIINYSNNSRSTGELESQFPFEGLIGCLRSKESIGAFSLEKQDGAAPPFCEKDQIGESFSDWMGSEVLADFTESYNSKLKPKQILYGYSNISRNHCNRFSPSQFDEHPNPRDRFDRIMMANPKIRGQIGCGSPQDGLHYCRVGEKFEGTRATFEEKVIKNE